MTTLLDCICCGKHEERTAIVWDDFKTGPPSFQTYQDLMTTSSNFSNAISRLVTSDSPIAIYGENCPEVLSAILAIMTVASVQSSVASGSLSEGVVKGVACLPLSPWGLSREHERVLYRCRVNVVLVTASAFEKFFSNFEKWKNLSVVSMDTTLLKFGFVAVSITPTSNWPLNCPVSSSIHLDQTALDRYKRDCDIGCYVCVQHQQSLSRSEISVHAMSTANTLTEEEPTHFGPSSCPTESCPANSGCPECFASSCPTSCPPASNECPECRIAYVLSTSGTSGTSKLIYVPHCSIMPNIVDLRSRFNISPNDVIFNAAPLTFDPSYVEIFLAFSSGSRLLVVPEAIKRTPSSLSDALFSRHYTSVLQITPTLFSRFDESTVARRILGEDSHIRVLAFGGEVCPSPDKLAKWRSPQNKTELFNMYGITEVSTWATCHQLTFPAQALTEVSPPSSPAPPLTLSSDSSPTCHLKMDYGAVPLGEPLLGTRVELRGSEIVGDVAADGQGAIWIGGEYRVCIVDDELECPIGYDQNECPVKQNRLELPSVIKEHKHPEGKRCPVGQKGLECPSGHMRCSGDWGRLDGLGQLLLSGRRDRQLKRWGHRINLDVIQNTITALKGVSSCVVVSVAVPGSTPLESLSAQLKAFVVPVTLDSLAKELRAKEQIVLWDRMREALPSHCLPDTLTLVESFPMTSHGKVDFVSLLKTSKALTDHTPSLHPRMLSVDYITSLLVSIATTMTHLQTCPVNVKLTDLGLNSFDIVRIANQLEVELEGLVGAHDGHVTMLLLESSLNAAAECIAAAVTSSSSHDDSRKRLLVPEKEKLDFFQVSKKARTTNVSGSHAGHVTVEFWRRGQHFINGNLQSFKEGEAVETSSRSLDLRVLWKVNTHKCIDASPLLVKVFTPPYQSTGPLKWGSGPPTPHMEVSKDYIPTQGVAETSVSRMGVTGELGVVYVGSHSHQFLAVEVGSGHVLWRSELGGRVESSACPSLCGEYVIVGCYDGCLYTLNATTGAIHWCYMAGPEGVELGEESACQPIKSSPCVDPQTGLVWFGSHDHHLYAVNIYMKMIVWRLYPGGGAIFSSPCISADKRIVFCATLKGLVAAVNSDSGEVLWRHSAPKPVFSSLSLVQSNQTVLFGCVDGLVYSLSQLTGNLAFKMSAEESIFSSMCVVHDSKHISETCVSGTGMNVVDHAKSKSGTKILCGSHSKCLFCWNQCAQLLWRTELDSAVYSTPFHHYFPQAGLECVCVCTTAGVLYLVDPTSGCVLCQKKMPGEIFSSPVCSGNNIILGCRDDYLYAVALSCAEKS